MARVGARAGAGGVALFIAVSTNGDLELWFGPEVAVALARALRHAAQAARDPTRVEHANPACTGGGVAAGRIDVCASGGTVYLEAVVEEDTDPGNPNDLEIRFDSDAADRVAHLLEQAAADAENATAG